MYSRYAVQTYKSVTYVCVCHVTVNVDTICLFEAVNTGLCFYLNCNHDTCYRKLPADSSTAYSLIRPFNNFASSLHAYRVILCISYYS